MPNKPILMIHKISDWMLKLPLEDYTLTFDDGLYNHYYYLEKLRKLKTEKIFFISTHIVNDETYDQSLEFPESACAHEYFFKTGNKNHFMNWKQIKEISQTENCFIGGHSHSHRQIRDLSLTETYQHLSIDLVKMLEEFEKHRIKINHFCYPYNVEHFIYREILTKNGITNFYGKERIDIESLRSHE